MVQVIAEAPATRCWSALHPRLEVSAGGAARPRLSCFQLVAGAGWEAATPASGAPAAREGIGACSGTSP